MSDFEEMIEDLGLATPRGTRMRRGDIREDIRSQGLAGIERVQGQKDPLSGDSRVEAPDIIGARNRPHHGRGTHDLDKFDVNLLQDYAYCVEQLGKELGMNGTLFEIMEENEIKENSKLSEAIKELIGILAYKVFFGEILLIDSVGPASPIWKAITDESLTLMEIAIISHLGTIGHEFSGGSLS
eukprot:scaffold14975_cov191-Amphora_coffeaeformis.AAC.1